MILVDPRDGADKDHIASNTLVRYILQRGVEAQKKIIPFGDLCFDGCGPNGQTLIGFERKTLYDMLDCIQTHRLTAKQIPGMKRMYGIHRFIIFEALWRSDENGYLLEGFKSGYSWRWAKTINSRQPVLYSTLYRFLISLQLAGNYVIYTHDLADTARAVCEFYHYFQKPWDQHTAMQEIQAPKIIGIDSHASLTRQWAHCIDGVGQKFSVHADRLFGSGLELAQSIEEDWMQIEGIGVQTAKDIIRQIEGRPKERRR